MRPIILTGKAFDWDEGARYGAAAVNVDDSVNWRAAFFADPGVMSCPQCKEHLWREGDTVRCPHCSSEFETPDSMRRRGAL